MMGRKEKMKGGAECDAFSKWKKVLHWEPGERKLIKRGFNKRVRRECRERLHEILSRGRDEPHK